MMQELFVSSRLFATCLGSRCFSVDINPFLTNIPILYPLKIPENQRFSGDFRGYKMEALAKNVLKRLPEPIVKNQRLSVVT